MPAPVEVGPHTPRRGAPIRTILGGVVVLIGFVALVLWLPHSSLRHWPVPTRPTYDDVEKATGDDGTISYFFDTYQIYQSREKVWVFLDVHREIAPGAQAGYGTSGGTGTKSTPEYLESHVYVIGKDGLLQKGIGHGPSSNLNLTYFFRHAGHVYACDGFSLYTLYRWHSETRQTGYFLRTYEEIPDLESKRPIGLPDPPDKLSHQEPGSEFMLIDSGGWGGRYDVQTYDVESVGVRISLGFGHPAHPWGACNVIAESLSPGSWHQVLLQLPDCPDGEPPEYALPAIEPEQELAVEDSPTRHPVAPQSAPFKLWTGPPIPGHTEQIPYVPGIRHQTVHKATAESDKFLHGAAIISHNGMLYANWANSPTNENGPHETLKGRRSADGGTTWSGIEVIGPGFPGPERHSHGILLEQNNELWAICCRFGVGDSGRHFTGLRAEAFVLNQQTDRWESRGVVMQNCWPYDEPVKLGNGNLITGGQDKDGLPVVAISRGNDLTTWDTISIPFAPGLKPSYAETTVWAEGAHVLAVIRGGAGVAWVSTSDDSGRTWSTAAPSNFPMPRAKAYLGKLSTGQLYLLSNLKNRNTLVISVSQPGEWTLRRMWRIRDGRSVPPRFPGRAKSRQWSYPYGHEHDGKLYVVYSIGKEDCGLSVLSIESLSVERHTRSD